MSDRWIETTLGEIARVDRGASWGKAQEMDDGSGQSVIRIANVQQSGLDLSEVRSVVGISQRDADRARITQTSLLMVGSNGNPDRIGNVYRAEGSILDFLLASFLIGVHAPDPLCASWLYYSLSSPATQHRISEATAGSTGLKNLSLEWLRRLPIALPPLRVQRRVVDLLEHLDTHLANLQTEVASVRDLFDAIPDPGPGVEKRPLGDHVKAYGGKRMPKGVGFSETQTTHPYLRVVDMNDGVFKSDSLEYVPDEVWPAIQRYVVRSGDLAISIVGTIGRVATVPDWADGANLTENAARIEILNPDTDREWLASWLQTPAGQSEIERVTVGTSQGKLALSRIPLIEVPVLSRTQQEERGAAARLAQNHVRILHREIAAAIKLRTQILGSVLSRSTEIPELYDELLNMEVAS